MDESNNFTISVGDKFQVFNKFTKENIIIEVIFIRNSKVIILMNDDYNDPYCFSENEIKDLVKKSRWIKQ